MSAHLWALASEHASHAKRHLREASEEYDEERRVPLRGYGLSPAAFTAVTARLALAGKATRPPLPERYNLLDVAFGGLSPHQFTRLLSKASVTSPLRPPLPRF